MDCPPKLTSSWRFDEEIASLLANQIIEKIAQQRNAYAIPSRVQFVILIGCRATAMTRTMIRRVDNEVRNLESRRR